MKFIPQHDQMDCGPACIAMITKMYGKEYPLQYLRDISHISKEGVSLMSISDAAEKIGFETYPSLLSIEVLLEEGTLPCVLHWNKNHFVVLYDVKKNVFTGKKRFKVADPSHGLITLSEEEFKKSWCSQEDKGIVLFLSPTEKFEEMEPPKTQKLTVSYLLNYLKPFKKQVAFMFSMLLLGSLVTLVFPFLTQNLIDKGVTVGDMNMITLILLAQLGLFLGAITIQIIRNSLTLYVGTKLSINIISDFLKKTLQLPIKFFDSKMVGDFNQRINDNERIEEFLTSQSLVTVFSIMTFSVFFGVLWYYDFTILAVYLALTVFSISWSYYFLKKRRMLDYFKFQQRAENQDSILEIINGVSEMKLNQFEEFKRKAWVKIQNKLFKTNLRILKIDQVQVSGYEFLNQLKNILVTFLAATYVVKGQMTIGELLSISYIIGQMNSPVNQLVDFFRSLQDAKLSLERLNEVQNHPEEETMYVNEEGEEQPLKTLEIGENIFVNNGIEKGIRLKNVSFQYEGPKSQFILKDINMLIPEGKVTAIVGASGSGKTTLLKLLLRFYDPTLGSIHYNYDDILSLSPKSIRENCGVVMQDGYIFSDTIERNIATGDEVIDYDKLIKAVRIANIEEYIMSLPLKLKTKIGASGNGISGGQKQRILIARAVYKNPHYIFFDEATSALDAENEKIIHDNLQEFFKDRTAVVIAHRLSTVKNADQIIVLKNGEIVEYGNHKKLVENKADYFHLVKNQLELGN